MLTLKEGNRIEFLDYAKKRISNDTKYYNFLTDKILNNVFTFYLNHELTATNKGCVYWVQNNKKIEECLGYSDGLGTDKTGMFNDLLHIVFCQSSWIGRSQFQDHKNVCINYVGKKSYNQIFD